MLAVYILAGIVAWLIIGCLVVACCVALGLTSIVKTDDPTDVACALILWPLAIIFSGVVLLGRLGVWIGEHPEWLIPATLFTIGGGAVALLYLL